MQIDKTLYPDPLSDFAYGTDSSRIASVRNDPTLGEFLFVKFLPTPLKKRIWYGRTLIAGGFTRRRFWTGYYVTGADLIATLLRIGRTGALITSLNRIEPHTLFGLSISTERLKLYNPVPKNDKDLQSDCFRLSMDHDRLAKAGHPPRDLDELLTDKILGRLFPMTSITPTLIDQAKSGKVSIDTLIHQYSTFSRTLLDYGIIAATKYPELCTETLRNDNDNQKRLAQCRDWAHKYQPRFEYLFEDV